MRIDALDHAALRADLAAGRLAEVRVHPDSWEQLCGEFDLAPPRPDCGIPWLAAPGSSDCRWKGAAMSERRVTFTDLHESARAQERALDDAPPDVMTGCDAIVAARVLFDWIAANVAEPGRDEVASAVTKALGLP